MSDLSDYLDRVDGWAGSVERFAEIVPRLSEALRVTERICEATLASPVADDYIGGERDLAERITRVLAYLTSNGSVDE